MARNAIGVERNHADPVRWEKNFYGGGDASVREALPGTAPALVAPGFSEAAVRAAIQAFPPPA